MNVQVNGDNYTVLHIHGTCSSEVWKNGRKYSIIQFTDDDNRLLIKYAIKRMISRERAELRDTQPGQQFVQV